MSREFRIFSLSFAMKEDTEILNLFRFKFFGLIIISSTGQFAYFFIIKVKFFSCIILYTCVYIENERVLDLD